MWFVAYRDATGKKFKKYGRLAHYSTLPERIEESKRIIKEILSPEIVNVQQREGLISSLQLVLDEKSYSLATKTYQNLVHGTIWSIKKIERLTLTTILFTCKKKSIVAIWFVKWLVF